MAALRVMTFNIRIGRALDGRNRWYRRRELVFDTIALAAAEVLGLQEVSPFQLDELLRAFPAYGAVADKRYGGRFTGTYAPILFDKARLEPAQTGDFWLAPDPDGRRARGWDAAVPRICTWATFVDREGTGERFAVFNTHFDQRGVTARVESARVLVAKLAEQRHVARLVMCDLNANETSEPFATISRAGFRDTYRLLHPDEEASTYHGFRGRGVRSLGKIDHIFCDERWEVCDAAIVRNGAGDRFPSDHFPVTAEVRLSAQTRR